MNNKEIKRFTPKNIFNHTSIWSFLFVQTTLNTKNRTADLSSGPCSEMVITTELKYKNSTQSRGCGGRSEERMADCDVEESVASTAQRKSA